MLKRLLKLRLPVDDFTDTIRKSLNLSKLTRRAPLEPFESLVTLELVRNPQVVEKAREYIVQLVKDKENLGYLYFLDGQKMFTELDVTFNFDLVVDCKHREEIETIIGNLAADMFCKNSSMNRITQLELLYFFIRLVNPDLNWLTIDYILQGCKHHAHLIAFKAKQYSANHKR